MKDKIISMLENDARLNNCIIYALHARKWNRWHRVEDAKVERIREISEQGKVRILFNEEVKINNKKGDLLKTCDVILFTNETVEVIRIVPMELDIINVNNDDESMILGIGVIDKFPTQMDCKYINLTVIQPNLITTSIYETSINKFLHEYDFSLIWS